MMEIVLIGCEVWLVSNDAKLLSISLNDETIMVSYSSLFDKNTLESDTYVGLFDKAQF